MLSCDGAPDGAREDAAASGSPGLDAGEFNADTLFLDVAQFVGILDGAPEHLFGSISSVATDAERRTYVGDRTGASVRAFAEDGGFLGWIAREGGGPGEINSWPANLLVGADGRLYVRDGARVTVFGTRTEGSMPDSVADLWNTGPGNLTSSRSGLARDGQYFYPGGRFRPNEPPRYFYTSFRDGEADGDTLPVPDYPGLTGLQPALLRLGVDALMLRGLSHVPFSAVPVWDVTPTGTLLSSDGASSILLETDERGDTVRGITLPQTSLRSVPARERADSLAALDERITGAPGPLNQATGIGDGVEDRRLPEFLPPVIGLSVSQDGSIWVERWPPEEDANSRYYDVLNGNGRLQRVVVLRAPLLRDPPPWFGSRSVVGVVRDAETGVERVARFDLPDLESTTR
jgi:hypothetical protein